MKAFDAIHLARELSRRGVPAVPVFWALTDDHDLQEIAQTARPDARGAAGPRPRGRRPPEPPARRPAPDPGGHRARSSTRSGPTRPADDGQRVLEAFARRSAPGTSLRRGVHRDAARPRGSGSAARARAARRGRCARRRSRSSSKRRGKADALRAALRSTEEKLRAAGRPVPAPVPEGFSFFAIDARGAPPHRRRPGRRRPRSRPGRPGPRPTS